MTQAIGLNPIKSGSTIIEENPCYLELIDRIAAIWNAICAWISQLFAELPASVNIARDYPDAFRQTMMFLEPEEIGRCETVCKGWKMPDRVWQVLCTREQVSYTLPEGKHKEAFSNPVPPSMAFGVKEWKEHLKADPGIAPRLSARIHRTVAKLKETHTLTLIPATVNGEPLCFNTFAPIAEKSGMRLNIWPFVSQKRGHEAQGKSLWVWMQKDVDPGSRAKNAFQVRRDYPQKLGKALWITVSTVAHYACYKICLFPGAPNWIRTRTCDIIEDEESPDDPKYVAVGNSTLGALGALDVYASKNFRYNDSSLGVAETFPA